MDRVRTFGLAAAGSVVVISTVILVVGSRSADDIGPPEVVPRGLALGLLLGVPAVIGALGVLRRDRVLLIAAAAASLGPAPISTVTLPLAIASLLFLVAAAAGTPIARRRTWLVAAAIAALQVGALVGLLATTESRCWVAYSADGGYVYQIVPEADTMKPMGGPGQKGGPGQPVASGCGGGALTARGLGLAAVLAIGAIALAIGAPKPRRPAPA